LIEVPSGDLGQRYVYVIARDRSLQGFAKVHSFVHAFKRDRRVLKEKLSLPKTATDLIPLPENTLSSIYSN
jgi:hypothetical protein